MKKIFATALVCLSASLPVWAQDTVTCGHALTMYGDVIPKYPPDFKHFEYINPNAPKGGELREGVQGEFNSYNDIPLSSDTPPGLGLIYDTLMRASSDEVFTLYGLLAERVCVPKSRKWVEFHLNPSAKWHDGHPVTAEDVQYAFQMRMRYDIPFARFYQGVAVEVSGDYTLRFIFSQPNREMPMNAAGMAPLPKHYWEQRNKLWAASEQGKASLEDDPNDHVLNHTTLEPPLGSGPYRIQKGEAKRYLIYERVENYWAKDLSVNRGQYNFDTLRYEFYGDPNATVQAFIAGDADVRSENVSRIWNNTYSTPAYYAGDLVKERFYDDGAPGMQAFYMNLRNPLFKDIHLRKALAYAFDFEWTNVSMFYGAYTRNCSFFGGPDMNASVHLPTSEERMLLEPFREQLPEEVFTETYCPPVADGSGNIRSNIAYALNHILFPAGYTQDEEDLMLRTPEGKRISFEILLVDSGMERIVLPFTGNLKRMGIDALVRKVDVAQYQNRVQNFDFDMFIMSYNRGITSPGYEQLMYWGSENANIQGAPNYAGVDNPVVDAMLKHVVQAQTRKELEIAVRALDRVLQRLYFVVPQWHLKGERVAYWKEHLCYPEGATHMMQGTSFTHWWYVESPDACSIEHPLPEE